MHRENCFLLGKANIRFQEKDSKRERTKTAASKSYIYNYSASIFLKSTSRLSHCNCLTTDFLKPPAGHFSCLAYNIISRFVQSRGTWYVGNVREDIHLVVPTPRREGRSGLYSKKDYKKEKRSRINLSWCKFYHGQNIFYIQLLFSF